MGDGAMGGGRLVGNHLISNIETVLGRTVDFFAFRSGVVDEEGFFFFCCWVVLFSLCCGWCWGDGTPRPWVMVGERHSPVVGGNGGRAGHASSG